MPVKTTAAFVPKRGRSPKQIMSDFVKLQAELAAVIRSGDGLPLDQVKIVSPFGGRMKYSAYSALVIIARHQHRHIDQAEEALDDRETSPSPVRNLSQLPKPTRSSVGRTYFRVKNKSSRCTRTPTIIWGGRHAVWCKAAAHQPTLMIEAHPSFFKPPYVGPSLIWSMARREKSTEASWHHGATPTDDGDEEAAGALQGGNSR